jgi:Lysosomal transcription factor, NCU-G1
MQIDLIAQEINYMNFSSPRVAVELLTVTSESKNEGSFNLQKRRNLDDEFTPGIFDVYNIVSPRSNNDNRGAFFQYRPVCYMTRERTVSGSTELNQGNFFNFVNHQNEIRKFHFTLPYAYYGYSLESKIAQATNITFGMPGDGFYSKSSYISFSMLMGIGAPPVEKLSVFVVTFAIIGLGVPLVVLLVGGIYVAVKRYNN